MDDLSIKRLDDIIISKHAYSILEKKSVNEETRTFEGIANTPTPDLEQDVLEPLGAEFALPVQLLLHHDAKQPVGLVTAARATKEGIAVKLEIMRAPDDAPPGLKNRLNEAWHSVKMGLIRGLSVGFIPKELAPIAGTFGHRISKWQWLELSLVTIPANQDATIAAIKSADLSAMRAALGDPHREAQRGRITLPGASGNLKPLFIKESQVRTIKEQHDAFAADRTAAMARMNAIMSLAAEQSRTLDETESVEHDELSSKVKSLDTHLTRLAAHEQQLLGGATPVPGTGAQQVSQPALLQRPDPVAASSAARGNSGIISVRSNLPKGTAFTRYCQATMLGKGSKLEAIEYARTKWPDTPEVHLMLKAAQDAGSTTDAVWAAPLAPLRQMSDEFIELLRPETIVGALNGFHRVPFNISMPRQTAGSSAQWVGQGAAKPVSELAFDTVILGPTKIASIVVLTEELVRFSNPSAEAVVRSDMIAVFSQFIDEQFLDPNKAAVANISPASVLNGVTPVVSSGSTVAAITADLNAVLDSMTTGNMKLTTASWVMRSKTARYISSLRTAQDVPAFQTTVMGGTLLGIPVLVSENVPKAGTPPAETSLIALVVPGEILLADDGVVTVDSSSQASIQMDNAPVAGAVALVSLWQNNLVGLRAERFIHWKKRRATAAGYVSAVAY